MNAIIAYAIAGVALGPALGIAEPDPEIEIILGIGIFSFFFLIGIDELDIRGFISAVRGRLFLASSLSLAISLLISLAVTSDILFDLQLGLDFDQALGLAGVLSLSSLGLVAKVLADEGRLKEPLGVQIFTAVVIAELIALFVIGITISQHFYATEPDDAVTPLTVLVVIGEILAFAVVTWLFSTKVLPWIIVGLHRFLRVPQLSFGVILGGLFLVVVGAEGAGLHGSLGALLFGAALSSLPYQVRRDVMPGIRSSAEGFFVPLFFASAGLHLSLDFLDIPVSTIAALVAVPLVGKFVGAFLSTYIVRLKDPFATATGLMGKGVAEVALLLLLYQTGAIDKALFSLLVLLMFGYMLLSPIGISYALRKSRRSDEVADAVNLPPSMLPAVLEGVRVGDILDRSRGYPEQAITLKAFADYWLLPEQFDYVVVNEGELAGIVSVTMLRYVPRSEWTTTRLSRVLRQHTMSAAEYELIEDVLQRMIDNSLTVIPVIDKETGRFIGSISSSEVTELITVTARGR